MNTQVVCLDATSLDSAHKYRGVGAYVAGLSKAIERSAPTMPIIKLRITHKLLMSKSVGESNHLVFRPLPPVSRMQWLSHDLLLCRNVKGTNASLFHATDFQGIAIDAAFRTLATAYDLIPLRFPREYLDTKALDFRLSFRSMIKKYKRAEHLVAISECTKRDFVELLQIDPARISVIPLGFDHAIFKPSVLCDELQARLEGKYFLYIGGHDFRKNIRFMLEAFARIKDDVQEDFVFVGKEGLVNKNFRRWIRELGIQGRVITLGFVPIAWLPGLYSRATAFIFCSLYEGFGLPALEAMACGCPVIASRTSSIPEVVGDAGLMVDPTDLLQTSDRMANLATNDGKRRSLRIKGLERAGYFSWSRCAHETLRLYSTLLAD